MFRELMKRRKAYHVSRCAVIGWRIASLCGVVDIIDTKREMGLEI